MRKSLFFWVIGIPAVVMLATTGKVFGQEVLPRVTTACEDKNGVLSSFDDGFSLIKRCEGNNRRVILIGEKGDKGDTGDRGLQGETGPQGEQGVPGLTGGDTFPWIFDGSNQDKSDPGTGKFKMNTRNPVASVTEIYIDEIQRDGASKMGLWIEKLTPGSRLKLLNDADSDWVIFDIVSVTNNSGWYTIEVAFVHHSYTLGWGPWGNGQVISFSYSEQGRPEVREESECRTGTVRSWGYMPERCRYLIRYWE